jgi:uncharacterized protein HemX
MRQRTLLVVVLAVLLAALGTSLGLSAYSYAQRRVARLEAELHQANATLQETRRQLEESRALTAELQHKLASVTVDRDVLARRRTEADRQIAALQEQIARLRQSRPAPIRPPEKPSERR